MAHDDQQFIQRSIRIGIISFVSLGVLFCLLWLLKSALTPLAISFVLAYLFDPAIDWFENRRVPRAAAILLLLSISGLSLFTAFFFFIPKMQSEIVTLSAELPNYLQKATHTFAPYLEERFGVNLPDSFEEALGNIDGETSSLVLETLRKMLTSSAEFFTGTLGAILALLVVPVLAFYFLVEFDDIKYRILEWVPVPYQDYVKDRAVRVDGIVSGFLRGQFTVCLILGVLYATGFSIIGIDLAIVIGMVAGLLAIIPYVGNGVAVSAAIAMSLLKFGVDLHILYIVGWYCIVQCLEGFVLTPKIVGESLGLHPVTVIIALMIGGDLLGFLGLLIAVPVAAVIKVFLDEILTTYRESDLYQGAQNKEGPS